MPASQGWDEMALAELFTAALEHHRAGRLAEAMAGYRQVLDQAPGLPDALYLLGTALLQGGDSVQAVGLIEQAIDAAGIRTGGGGPEHAPLFGNLGSALQACGRIDESIAAYRRALALAPDQVETRGNLGNVLLARGEAAAAAETYRAVLAIKPDFAECWFNLGVAQTALGDPEAACESYRAAIRLRRGYADAHNNLGNLLLAAGRLSDGLEALRAAAAADPRSADIAINLASALHAAGQADMAIARYREIMTVHPREAGAPFNLGNALLGRGDRDGAAECYRRAIALRPDYAEAHFNLAKLRHDQGELRGAEDGYRSALAFQPAQHGALFNLGNLLVDQARFTEAAAQLRHLVAVHDDDARAHCLLGVALRGAEKYDDAVAHYRRAIALDPSFAEAHYNLGHVLADCGRYDDAIVAFEAAIAHKPNYPEALRSLGYVLQSVDRPDAATAAFAQALRLQPLITRPAIGKPSFGVLLLVAPGSGNTPIDYLVQDTAFDSHIVLFLPGFAYDLARLRGRADVVVNLISDVDLGAELLGPVADLLAKLGRPVINHPDRIRPTDRAAIAATLRDLSGAVVPQTCHVDRAALLDGAPLELAFPLLLRPAGTHGGDDMELVTEAAQIAPLVAGMRHERFYLTQYVDYRSADGRFRKYRLIFVGGQVLPYHLAIADHWKVHYYRTDMMHQAWMRDEEARFLTNPGAALGAPNLAALEAIRARIGLDFFGIDCGIDRDGRLIVFEVNASMLVHDDAEAMFAYKQEPVERIKGAFATMLADAANRPGA